MTVIIYLQNIKYNNIIIIVLFSLLFSFLLFFKKNKALKTKRGL